MATFQFVMIAALLILVSGQQVYGFFISPGVSVQQQASSVTPLPSSHDETRENSGNSLEGHSADGSRSSEENVYTPLLPFGKPSTEFLHASVAAISVIVVSEIGDKTFFIAVILAMRHSRMFVFCGAMAALALMTILSAVLGQVTTLIPRIYVHYASVVLFVIFGLKMIKEGYCMQSNEKSEYDEVQKTIQSRESKLHTDANVSLEAGVKQVKKRTYLLLWVFLEAFTMTFLAEWGDRSQLTTIILAARENMYGVIFGAIIGHAGCTLLAVVGGRIVADRISVKAVTITGGIVFLAFAIWAVCIGPGEETMVDIANFFAKPTEVYVDASSTNVS